MIISSDIFYLSVDRLTQNSVPDDQIPSIGPWPGSRRSVLVGQTPQLCTVSYDTYSPRSAYVVITLTPYLVQLPHVFRTLLILCSMYLLIFTIRDTSGLTWSSHPPPLSLLFWASSRHGMIATLGHDIAPCERTSYTHAHAYTPTPIPVILPIFVWPDPLSSRFWAFVSTCSGLFFSRLVGPLELEEPTFHQIIWANIGLPSDP